MEVSEPLPGTVFGLFKADCTEFTKEYDPHCYIWPNPERATLAKMEVLPPTGIICLQGRRNAVLTVGGHPMYFGLGTERTHK